MKRSIGNSIHPITQSNRWRGCPREPALLKRPRNKTYDFLADAVEAIAKAGAATVEGLPRLLKFHNNPHPVQRFERGVHSSLRTIR